MPTDEEPRSLPRKLGLFSASTVVMSAVVGGGIFISPSLVAQIVHSPSSILLAWGLGGLLALAGAFVFAELSTVMPYAGGEYVFFREAYHPIVGFLYGWTLLWVIGSGAISALAVALCEYLVRLTHWPEAAVGPLAFVTVVALTGYHALGIRPGMILINVITVSKLAVFVALIAAAILAPAHPVTEVPTASPIGAHGALWSFLAALLPVMYAYSGWQKLSQVAGEVTQPARNLPRAIILGVTLVIALYLTANVAYLRALTPEGLARTSTPAAEVAAALWGTRGERLMSVVIIVSVFGSLNLALMTAPRVYYAMARDGLFFSAMSRIHPKSRVPVAAIWLQGGVGAVLAASGSFQALVQYKVFGEWVFLVLSGLALMVMRRKAPDAVRPVPTPLYPVTPIVFSLAGVGILIGAFLTNPLNAAGGVLVIALGAPVYLLVSRSAQRSARRAAPTALPPV